MRSVPFLFAAVIFCSSMPASADVKPAKPADLAREATHIVVGKVIGIYTSSKMRKDSEMIQIVAEISIQKVEKGNGLQPEQLVYVRYWQTRWTGKTPERPDSSFSFHNAPKAGNQVRVYLGLNAQNGLGNAFPPGSYNVLLPNGFQVLAKEPPGIAK